MSKERLFKNYGVGVGLRPTHLSTFLDAATRPNSVEWVEVIAENYMDGRTLQNTRTLPNLEKIRRDFPVALHGVSLSIGSMHGLDLDYLKKFKALVDRIDPIVISDHLCWTRIHGVQTHDLNPLPYTQALVEHVSDKIKQVQDFMGRRMLIENVSSYLTFEQSTMPEEEFVSRVTERADCGLLLDVNNVYVSSINHGFDAKEFLKKIPHHRVGQMHIAGHTRHENGFLIDTHDELVPEAVWDLFRWYGENFGHPSSMIERDGNIPEWKELEGEVLKLKSMFQPDFKPQTPQTLLKIRPVRGNYTYDSQQQWARSLMAGYEVTGIRNQAPLSSRDRFAVYEDAFWMRVNEAVSEDFIQLRTSVTERDSEEAWDQLVFDALSKVSPESWSLNELGFVFLKGLKQLNFHTREPQLFAFAEQDWAKICATLMANAVTDAHRDFTALQGLTEAQLNEVILVLHPSAQILSSQQRAVWFQGNLNEKHFSSDEWKGMMCLLEQTPMVEMTEHPLQIQEWVKLGLVHGWKLKSETKK